MPEVRIGQPWPVNSEGHAHMKMRQLQNRVSCLKSEAEDWMKSLLEDTGYKWTRQAQWGFRLFDFWCHEIGVAVEVDGPEHDTEEDAKRDLREFFRSAIVVYRVPNFNKEVASAVLRAISAECDWNQRRELLKMKPIKNAHKKENEIRRKFMSIFKDFSGSPNLEQAGVPGREETNSDNGSNKQLALEKAAMVKRDMVESASSKQLEKISQLTSLDWKNIPPPMLAQILIQIPFKGSGSDPDYFLSVPQALIFAMRCYELGLSPFSNEVWFNPKNNKVNVTFEGKLKLARMNGMKLSPPRFVRDPLDKKLPLISYTCIIDSPTGPSEYTATLKDWQVASSPVWKAKPEHMLQLRAAEKCLSFATGSGASELPDDRDLQVGNEANTVLPTIEVK